jgi:hypothetical protein
MDSANPQRWPEPSEEHRCEDPSYGLVYVRAWTGLHPKTHNHPCAALAAHVPQHGACWFWWKSLACHARRESRESCGCDGLSQESLTSTSFGEPR